MSWGFDHWDSHYPWKQFNQLGSGGTAARANADVELTEPPSASSTGSPHYCLLLVKPNGDPVYEQRQT